MKWRREDSALVIGIIGLVEVKAALGMWHRCNQKPAIALLVFGLLGLAAGFYGLLSRRTS